MSRKTPNLRSLKKVIELAIYAVSGILGIAGIYLLAVGGGGGIVLGLTFIGLGGFVLWEGKRWLRGV